MLVVTASKEACLRGGLVRLVFCLTAAVVAVVGWTTPAAAKTPRAVKGQYLIKFKSSTKTAAQAALRVDLGAEVLHESALTGTQLVDVTDQKRFDRRAKELLASGAVQYIEPNYIYSIERTPNDPRFDELWGLHNSGQGGGTANIDIDAPEAWDLASGASQVVVGVVDTGINYNHPDLKDNMWKNPNEIAGNNVDDDGNGVIDDVYGYNAFNRTGNPLDDNGHGSHTAGTIGASGNSGAGVVGVNWNVKLMALKFLNSSGSGTTDAAINAIDYAVRMKRAGVNIRVLNNSWGGGGFSQALQDAVAAANDAGILFVAAAGNAGSDNDAAATYPANFQLPNVISVAAVDRDGNLASFSNYGVSTVHLAAPGVAILSTVLGSNYSSLNGTSMATPHVSGVAALLLGRESGLNTLQVKNRLMTTVKPLSTLVGLVSSPGMVDAYNTLTNTLAPTPPTGSSIKYAKLQQSYTWDDNLGSRVITTDDGYFTTDLPFQFPYYRENFSRIAISANGRVLPLRSSEAAPTAADYSNRLIAGINPYHDDLYPSPSADGGVWFKSDANGATITWVSINYAHRSVGTAEPEIRVQLDILKSGAVQFQYRDTTTGDNAFSFGASASIGLVPPSGVAGTRLTVTNNAPVESEVGNSKALAFDLKSRKTYSDFDGDGKSDIAVWRPSNGTWYVLTSSSNFSSGSQLIVPWGLAGDVPFALDFDGDDRADFTVWRPSNGTWYTLYSATSYSTSTAVQWGLAGDRPVPGDYDGDGRSDPAVYRMVEKVTKVKIKARKKSKRVKAKRVKKYKTIKETVGTYFVLKSSTGLDRSSALGGQSRALLTTTLGGVGNDPIVGDFTGDGKDDFATVYQLVRLWSVKDSGSPTNVLWSTAWGNAGDSPLACDYDLNGKSDRLVVRVDSSLSLDWYVISDSNQSTSFRFGLIGDIPSCNHDFDGDSLPDIAVYRTNSGHWLYKSSLDGGAQKVHQFGLPGDSPL